MSNLYTNYRKQYVNAEIVPKLELQSEEVLEPIVLWDDGDTDINHKVVLMPCDGNEIDWSQYETVPQFTGTNLPYFDGTASTSPGNLTMGFAYYIVLYPKE